MCIRDRRLSVEDKLNYKTYLKWDIPDDLPDNISYEVYRSTNEDFIPDESTRVASDIKAGYYTEINAWHGKDHYYKAVSYTHLDVYKRQHIECGSRMKRGNTKMDHIRISEELLDFAGKSPSAFHAVANIAGYLEARGFRYLPETAKWDVAKEMCIRDRRTAM